MLDDVGHDVMDRIRDGDLIELRDGAVWRDGEKIASGEQLQVDDIEARMDDARQMIGVELRHFAENTLEYMQREAELTFEPLELPPLDVEIRGRHAVVVVRGHDYRHDLRTLRPYIKEYQPVLIAVDGGADALLEVGLTSRHHHRRLRLALRPRVRLRRANSCTTCTRTDAARAARNSQAKGAQYEEFVAEGMSEDVAMLLAYEAGATLIVAVGTHATMVEFLDKGRRGMASTFLTRLRLGPVLVDAKGVSRLYEGRIRRRDMLLLVASALAAMVSDGDRVRIAADVRRRFPPVVRGPLALGHGLIEARLLGSSAAPWSISGSTSSR